MTRLPAYQVLADDLRTRITSGELNPGDRLPTEPQLCERSGLSRSTVREALRLLASQHLIVTTRGVTGGSFVAQPSTGQIGESLSTSIGLLLSHGSLRVRDLIEVGAALEIPAAELAADRRTDEDLTNMENALFDPHVDDFRRMIVMHGLFHRAIAAATGNPLYEVISRPLYELTQSRELAANLRRERWTEYDADHREILGCIRDRNALAAGDAARRHMERIRTGYLDRPISLAEVTAHS